MQINLVNLSLRTSLRNPIKVEIASSQAPRNDSKYMTPLAKSILKTLAFFDAQDMPLTLMEVRNYLVSFSERSPSLMELKNTLETELADKVSFARGFYCLKGHEHLIKFRHRNYRISLPRMRKAKKILYFLRFMPYLRAVALSGSQAMLNSGPDSDIDLFIITGKNRIWLARMLVSLYFQILGQRRHGLYITNRFCLNHYIIEDAVLEDDRNLYTAVLYSNLLGVIGQDKLVNFWRNNSWIKDYTASPRIEEPVPLFGFRFSFVQQMLEGLLEITFLGPLLNWLTRLYQKNRIQIQDHVLISDLELSFHPESKGQIILTKFRNSGLDNNSF